MYSLYQFNPEAGLLSLSLSNDMTVALGFSIKHYTTENMKQEKDT